MSKTTETEPKAAEYGKPIIVGTVKYYPPGVRGPNSPKFPMIFVGSEHLKAIAKSKKMKEK